MKKLLAIAAVSFGIFANPALTPAALAEAQAYKFDPTHTELLFSYRHLGMSRAYAQFKKIDGVVNMDKSAPEKSSVDVTIDVNSIDTGVTVFDEHLRSKDFFNAAKFPKATFKSTKVTKTGAKTYKVAGNLTIKGKTKPVTLDMEFIVEQEHPLAKFNPAKKGVYVAAFSAKTSIKRSDFGMGQYAPATSDKVDIIIETEMFRQ